MTPAELLSAERAAHRAYEAARDRWYRVRDGATEGAYLTARRRWEMARADLASVVVAELGGKP